MTELPDDTRWLGLSLVRKRKACALFSATSFRVSPQVGNYLRLRLLSPYCLPLSAWCVSIVVANAAKLQEIPPSNRVNERRTKRTVWEPDYLPIWAK
jgi:hypothetical protein